MMIEQEKNIEANQQAQKVDIIWTLDKVCAWHCSFCSVDAHSVTKRDGNIFIESNGFNFTTPYQPDAATPYMQAVQILREKGLALTLEEKLKILDNLVGMQPRIDFSGGDLLLVDDNLEVIKRASKLFGKDNISITVTGVGIMNSKIDDYIDYIGELEFTYDNLDDNDANHRQSGYNRSNLRAFTALDKDRIRTKALIPLSKSNTHPDTIRWLYEDLHAAGVDSILLLRTFPVGRGALMQSSIFLEKTEYMQIIEEYRKLEQRYQKPRIKLQCALKNLFPSSLTSNPCGLVDTSLGITSTGQLVASPWAYDQFGNVLHPELILGDLKNQRLVDIYSQERSQNWIERKDENFGHCKVFAFLSDEDKNIEAIFEKSDPLYTDKA